ncbi:MAG: NAD(P)-dependent oxidoreductase [Deltaproteobacteria bacterium]|nr:NAD(P)-dependent oxidoreductase [Deltaproteobacteria bacterium]
MKKRKVLVTGAAGVIASQVLPALRHRYELTLLDVRTRNRKGDPIEGVQTADLVDRDRDAYRHHFQGIDTVVHLGFIRHNRIQPEPHFRAEMDNIQMAYNVYQTCLEEGVRRVVVASSNHAADYYEPLILDGKMDFVDPGGRAQSDNYYGWAKEVYEHLGFVFAVGRQTGRPLENIQIRIGGPREDDLETCRLGDLRAMRRALAVYVSDRDLQQLFVKSIETPDIRDGHGVPFQIFYGISNNPHAYWSIANARRVIGYEPEDNSEIRFCDWIAKHIRVAKEK